LGKDGNKESEFGVLKDHAPLQNGPTGPIRNSNYEWISLQQKKARWFQINLAQTGAFES
jgi:hypothetical protein